MKTKLAPFLVIGFLLTASSSRTIAGETKPVSLIRMGRGLVVMVDVTVGGSPRHLMLDTGASVTILTPEVAGWSPAKPVESASPRFIAGLGSSTYSMGSTTAALDFGHTVVVTNASVVELTGLSKALHVKLDGILGQDVLSQFARITIDYKNKQMVIEK